MARRSGHSDAEQQLLKNMEQERRKIFDIP
jgi:hypothetical protein